MADVCSEVSGSVWKIECEVGQSVSEGDTLVIVESMKMEFAITAPRAGRVWNVLVKEGGAVQAGQDVVVLE